MSSLGSDLTMLSIPEIYESSICLIEWPQRMAESFLPSRYLQVNITINQDLIRTVELRFEGDGENQFKSEELMSSLESVLGSEI